MGVERQGERGMVNAVALLTAIDNPQASWTVPQTLSLADLEKYLGLLKNFVDEPPSFENEKMGKDFLRRKVERKSSSEESDDQSLSDDSDSSDGPRKSNRKRKRKALDDEEISVRTEKRRLADLEKQARIKSDVRILDSDDDEEFDMDFFEREKDLRRRMEEESEEMTIPGVKSHKIGSGYDRSDSTQPSSPPFRRIGDEELIPAQRSQATQSNDDDGSEGSDAEGVEQGGPTKKRKVLVVDSDEE
jgi:replication fork protection complex subunit Tof1/Swi1